MCNVGALWREKLCVGVMTALFPLALDKRHSNWIDAFWIRYLCLKTLQAFPGQSKHICIHRSLAISSMPETLNTSGRATKFLSFRFMN